MNRSLLHWASCCALFATLVGGCTHSVESDRQLGELASKELVADAGLYDDPKLTADARAWADERWAPLQQYIRAPYLNMLEYQGEAGVPESYGANYPRLRKLKARYDPDNIFRSNQNILPA